MGALFRWTSPPSIISLLSICLLSFSVKAVFFPDHDLSSLPKPEYDLYKKARMDSFVEVTASAPPHQRPTLGDLTQLVTGNRDPNEVSPIKEDTGHEDEMLQHEFEHEVEPNGVHK
ncbi:hypothetical protein PGT21_023109 [Puccinia graminis f. sp. tritici]|uniref:Uncharacterized protein n=2 Tax=Puccinia graminis f. sp. tritici TaxID=56615 RepID=H6QQH7_PUCGT|nr:uncharacterized protein PGTG_21185 [Puccinia graminis f. sp. tritici CRL 75-36-700-3]EHS62677.1 hypothetical protein PGTG_21185 [Puccinia graminis f. sp. tritici CRL 75-36-700-3]KAA1087121.1 hypothetical protein PGT21_023109 [Puccinia graminis f. sp. tritici]